MPITTKASMHPRRRDWLEELMLYVYETVFIDRDTPLKQQHRDHALQITPSAPNAVH